MSFDLKSARTLTGATIGWPGWGLLYSLILCHLPTDRPAIVLETGTNFGATSTLFAQALIDRGCPESKVLTFELDPMSSAKAREMWKRAGVSHMIELVEGDVRQTLLPSLREYLSVTKCRFALLDASHLEKDVAFEFECLVPFLATDAIVAFDNTYCLADEGEDQRVNGFLRRITNHFGGNLVNLPYCSWYTPGVAIWQKAPAL